MLFWLDFLKPIFSFSKDTSSTPSFAAGDCKQQVMLSHHSCLLFQFAYVCWLSPNICILWLCSEVGAKQPNSPQPGSSLSLCSERLTHASYSMWLLWNMLLKASLMVCYRSLSSAITLGQCSTVGPPVRPSFLAVWPWTILLSSLELSFIIFKMEIYHST